MEARQICLGKTVYPNGDVFLGDLGDLTVTGRGAYTFTDSEVYEGGFKNGQAHGYGTHKYINKNVSEYAAWKRHCGGV